MEIVVKTRIGRLSADMRAIARAIEMDCFDTLDILPAHLRTPETLPTHHRDPFDHLLIAQAMSEQALFISDDRRAAKYPVKVIDCAGAATPWSMISSIMLRLAEDRAALSVRWHRKAIPSDLMLLWPAIVAKPAENATS